MSGIVSAALSSDMVDNSFYVLKLGVLNAALCSDSLVIAVASESLGG